MIKINLNGKFIEIKESDSLTTITQNEGIRGAVGAYIGNVICDLDMKIKEPCEVRILTFKDEDGKKIYWHTCAHIFAQAIKRLYPDVHLAIGPPIDRGFYYDIDMQKKLTNDDFFEIEEEMRKIINEDHKIIHFNLNRESAYRKMNDQPYKIEIMQELDNESFSFYQQDDYLEMCKGPHLLSTGKVDPDGFKILSVAGAYWRGDEKNKMLQRIYGIAFETKQELDNYLMMIEESKRRDHRKLGKELELFMFGDEGPGFVFFLPKGKIVRNQLEKYWRGVHERAGYDEISTPIMLNKDLWVKSGHWDHYKENMYFTKIDEKEFAIKPMNCPGSILVYKLKPHSYKDLPLKYAEMGLVHRHENSGNLHGLLRVRCFTQDDAHIFLTEDQIENQIIEIIELIDSVYKQMGFSYFVELSTRPENSMGTDEEWEIATNGLKNALQKKNIKYKLNEGDGAFYGPKIDFHIQDCLKRTWQCGTVQLDFQMPEKFGITYIGKDGGKHRPVMIHRVVFGSIERFIAILIEHTGGKLPLWLAPVQVSILSVNENFIQESEKISEELKRNGINRVFVDKSNEKIGQKIRIAQENKIPYMLVIGKKEIENNVISVRHRTEGDIGAMKLSEFIKVVNGELQKIEKN